MTNRYQPNEAASPISLELLALLLRSDRARIAEVVEAIPAPQRAALAAFCFSRCHMRTLSFHIAASCDERSLRIAAGAAGEILIEQSRNPTSFDTGPMISHRRKVTLARAAA